MWHCTRTGAVRDSVSMAAGHSPVLAEPEGLFLATAFCAVVLLFSF